VLPTPSQKKEKEERNYCNCINTRLFLKKNCYCDWSLDPTYPLLLIILFRNFVMIDEVLYSHRRLQGQSKSDNRADFWRSRNNSYQVYFLVVYLGPCLVLRKRLARAAAGYANEILAGLWDFRRFIVRHLIILTTVMCYELYSLEFGMSLLKSDETWNFSLRCKRFDNHLNRDMHSRSK
jgi:hypothetical protein